MKGVIVQIGNPKSIVLFNNGKISAIPTPLDAHVGMVVTVNLNNRAKIFAIVVVAVILLTAGIGIGIFVSKSVAKQNHGQYANEQKIERQQKTEQNQHDTSVFSFQKGKEENRSESE